MGRRRLDKVVAEHRLGVDVDCKSISDETQSCSRRGLRHLPTFPA
jgi:hypothetical protein